jgi:heme oxygenase (mycobilin-producing)
MVTIGMNYRVIAGQERVFEEAFAALAQTLATEPGHTASHLYREVGDPQRYLILSDWRDRAAYDAFVGSERFARIAAWGKKNILAERPRHEVYERDAGS